MDLNFEGLRNGIDDKGKIIMNEEQRKQCFALAEEACKTLLGKTLNVRGNKFIIRMLEIYYGSIGDSAHDWYRNRYIYKTSKFKEQTEAQNKSGPRIYLSSTNIKDSYTRMDIVVGPKDVAISFLLRSVWNEKLERIGSNKGNPNVILQNMGILSTDHDKEIAIGNSNLKEIQIEETSDEILQKLDLTPISSQRINVTDPFEEINQLQWNLCINMKTK